MPMIRPSSDLRNKYADISEYCRQHDEPVFITKNGVGDLAVMSMEVYERLSGIVELRSLLEKGLKELGQGKSMPAADFFAALERGLNDEVPH